MSTEFQYDVFLSHCEADKPRVRQLAKRLRKAGLRVWFDESAIQPGDDIYLAIERGLEAARTLVLCLSPAALRSDSVGLERSTVLFRDPANAGHRFIPLLLADCKLPDTLGRFKYVDYREETDTAFEALLAACPSSGKTLQAKCCFQQRLTSTAGTYAAVRRFFTESRQYYLAVIAVAPVYFGIQIARTTVNMPGWFSLLALVPLLLVCFFQTLPRRWRARRERTLIRCSLQADDALPPRVEPLGDYFLIGPYPERRREGFKRADRRHEFVLDWVRQARQCVLVLTGNSGTGKTSLLQAFVIPRLIESTPPCKVLLLRSFDDPLAELRRQLAKPGEIWPKPPAGLDALSWGEFLSRVVERLRRNSPGTRLVVVLDQFEEFVLLDPAGSGTARVTAMREFLQSLSRQAPDGFNLVLALRSDYKTFLESLGVPPLQQGLNWEDVPAFRQRDAAEFLSAPATGLNFKSPEQLNHVLAQAAEVDGTRELIRPIVLNMLGVVLQRTADGPGAERSTRTLLADDVRQVVNNPRLRDLARPILRHMLTDADTKRPRALGELAQETGLALHVIQGCLLDLELSGYVRQLSRTNDVASRVWEISHDFVARLLGPILKTPLQTAWQRTAAVLYPLALVMWLLAVAGIFLLGPALNRRQAEGTLKEIFGMEMEQRAAGWHAAQSTKRSQLDGLVSALRKLPPISGLDLNGWSGLEHVNELSELTNLCSVNLAWCIKLRNLDGLTELTSLQTLDLSGCTALTNLDRLKGLKSLRTLIRSSFTALTTVDDLMEFESLQTLDLSRNKALTNLHGLKELKNLESITLSGCAMLTSADGLVGLRSLQRLDLSDCTALASVGGLKELTNMQTLNLKGCKALTSIDGLKDLQRLQVLNLGDCGALANVDSFAGLKSLQTLELWDYKALTSVVGLKELKSLQRLNLTGCEALASVDGLQELKNLETLGLNGCKALASVDGLRELKNLQTIDLSGCVALTNLDSFSALKSLKTLKINRCTQFSREAVDRLKQNLPNTNTVIEFQ